MTRLDQLRELESMLANYPHNGHQIDTLLWALHNDGEETPSFKSIHSPIHHSIDAALSWTEKMLPGWSPVLFPGGKGSGAQFDGEDGHLKSFGADTLPLAILKAAVAALIEREEANGKA